MSVLITNHQFVSVIYVVSVNCLFFSSFYVPVLFFVFFLQFLWTYDFDVHAFRFSFISMVTQECEWFL